MVVSKKIAPNLLKIVQLIEDNRLEIGTAWIKIKTVKQVFKARKISPTKFRDGYGVFIIDYFTDVVRAKVAVGNCPIMSKLVKFLIKKGISPQEVFDICMGFRKSLIAFLLQEKNVLKNPLDFMEEVSIIFDANLSGVLKIFTDLYTKSQKEHQRLQQTLKIINYINTKIVIVENGKIIMANKPFFEMLGVANVEDLYSKYEKGFEYLENIDTYNDDFKVNTARWIRKTCKSNKPFRCEVYNKAIEKTFNYSGRITNVPDSDIDKYLITFNNISAHIEDEETIRDNLTHDEITGFKNYPTFEKFIASMIQSNKDKAKRIFFAVADIPDLKEINSKYNKNRGDMVIAEVAEDLRFLVDENIYLARLEGSRFGILLQYDSEQLAYDWCVKLYKKMNEREYRKTISITEVDLSESVNKLFLRAYYLIEYSNTTEDILVGHDFENIKEYKDLPPQEPLIKQISKSKKIDMTVFYMELPIFSEVLLASSTNKIIKVMTSKKQMKVVEEGMNIYFTIPNLGNIKANIKDIDINKRILVLDSFRLSTKTPLNREMYRIKVKTNIKAFMEENKREYKVKIIDINYEHVAVEISRKRNFELNSNVILNMILLHNNNKHTFIADAVIIKISKVPYGGYKMVLSIKTNEKNKQMLQDYISQCQQNIIHELLK